MRQSTYNTPGCSASSAALVGKCAIVTGSTSGIGLGIAQAFAKAGRKDIASSCGVEVVYSGADMSKSDDIVKMVEDARTTLGEVDVLVNNAGIQHVEAIETFPVAKWDAIIAIDLSSAFLGCLARLVYDRDRARAAVFDDRARDDVDDRRALRVTVPGNLATGLNDEPT